MAVKDKARVRARLSAKYPKASRITSARLDVIAAKLKATDESSDEDIDAELEQINDGGLQTFEQIVIEDDKYANAVNNPKKKTAEEENTVPKEETTDPSVLALQKQMQELQGKLAAKEAQETLDSLHARFRADERLKKVPASWVKNNLPKTEDDYETTVSALSEEFKQFATDHKLQSITVDAPPGSTKVVVPEGEKVSKEEAASIVKGMLRGR